MASSRKDPQQPSPCDSWRCFGGQAKCDFGDCEPNFSIATGTRQTKIRFADKFCARCRTVGVAVSAERVRALPEHMETSFTNSQRGGFWSSLKGSGHDEAPIIYRVVNNRSRDSPKPVLVVFSTPSPPEHMFDPVPEEWCEDGRLPFVVTNGTFMPSKWRATAGALNQPDCPRVKSEVQELPTGSAVPLGLLFDHVLPPSAFGQLVDASLVGMEPNTNTAADELFSPEYFFAQLPSALDEPVQGHLPEPTTPPESHSSGSGLSSTDSNSTVLCQPVQTHGTHSMFIDVVSANATPLFFGAHPGLPTASAPVHGGLHAQAWQAAPPHAWPEGVGVGMDAPLSALREWTAGGPMRRHQEARTRPSPSNFRSDRTMLPTRAPLFPAFHPAAHPAAHPATHPAAHPATHPASHPAAHPAAHLSTGFPQPAYSAAVPRGMALAFATPVATIGTAGFEQFQAYQQLLPPTNVCQGIVPQHAPSLPPSPPTPAPLKMPLTAPLHSLNADPLRATPAATPQSFRLSSIKPMGSLLIVSAAVIFVQLFDRVKLTPEGEALLFRSHLVNSTHDVLDSASVADVHALHAADVVSQEVNATGPLPGPPQLDQAQSEAFMPFYLSILLPFLGMSTGPSKEGIRLSQCIGCVLLVIFACTLQTSFHLNAESGDGLTAVLVHLIAWFHASNPIRAAYRVCSAFCLICRPCLHFETHRAGTLVEVGSRVRAQDADTSKLVATWLDFDTWWFQVSECLQSRFFSLFYFLWVSLLIVSQFSESRFLTSVGIVGVSFCVLCHVVRTPSCKSHKPMKERKVIGITAGVSALGMIAVIALLFTDLSNFKGLQVFNNQFLGRWSICQVMELIGVYGVALNMMFGIVFASVALKRDGYHRFLFLVCLLLHGSIGLFYWMLSVTDSYGHTCPRCGAANGLRRGFLQIAASCYFGWFAFESTSAHSARALYQREVSSAVRAAGARPLTAPTQG